MSWSTTPIIGTLNLSGTRQAVISFAANVATYDIVGLEGGVISRYGRDLGKITMNGIFFSGSDDMDDKLFAMIGKSQTITIPSVISGSYFFNGTILFDRVAERPDPGQQYPYYEWFIYGLVSGVVTVVPSALTGSGITYTVPNIINAQTYTTFVQPNIINAQIYIDYVKPNVVNSQAYIGYVLISGVSGF